METLKIIAQVFVQMCEYETKEFLASFFLLYRKSVIQTERDHNYMFFFEKVTGVVRKVMNKIKYNDEETEKG